MATDLAEVVGGAIALNLIVGMPLFTGGLVTGAVAFFLLALQSGGDRRFIGAVTGLFTVVLVAFLLLALWVPIDPGGAAAALVPRFRGIGSLVLAARILGATVTPHAIYLHSALTPGTEIHGGGPGHWRTALRQQRADVLTAMSLAGLANVVMLLVAAALSAGSGLAGTDTLARAHAGYATAVNGSAALLFALALRASGLAASGVGTYISQVIMQGFPRRSVRCTR